VGDRREDRREGLEKEKGKARREGGLRERGRSEHVRRWKRRERKAEEGRGDVRG
jgi:hypothetical protein